MNGIVHVKRIIAADDGMYKCDGVNPEFQFLDITWSTRLEVYSKLIVNCIRHPSQDTLNRILTLNAILTARVMKLTYNLVENEQLYHHFISKLIIGIFIRILYC